MFHDTLHIPIQLFCRIKNVQYQLSHSDKGVVLTLAVLYGTEDVRRKRPTILRKYVDYHQTPFYLFRVPDVTLAFCLAVEQYSTAGVRGPSKLPLDKAE